QQFVLDMMINTGGFTVGAQQAYLTFTYQLLDNVSATATSCTLANIVTPDLAVFEAVLQNEVCNGPNPCVFRGSTVGPGSIAFASGAFINPPYGGPDFEVARVAFCATHPGRAVLHWQFSPPNPVTRDTEVVDNDVQIVNDPNCYED